MLTEYFQRMTSVLSGKDSITGLSQYSFPKMSDKLLIVYQKNGFFAAGKTKLFCQASGSSAVGGTIAGKYISKVVPEPGSLEQVICPLCCLTIP